MELEWDYASIPFSRAHANLLDPAVEILKVLEDERVVLVGEVVFNVAQLSTRHPSAQSSGTPRWRPLFLSPKWLFFFKALMNIRIRTDFVRGVR